ncbi:MAG: P27 family phage terminase small subunit [Anaerofustis sp.]
MPKKRRPELIAKNSMVKLGVYKKEFDPIIKIYGQLMEQYEVLTDIFIESGFDYEESTAQGTKKAPIVTTLEALRKDILSYASQLGLTPQGLLRTDDAAFRKQKRSAISDALKAASSG